MKLKLLIGILFLSNVFFAHAQQADSLSTILEEIIISENRLATPFLETARNIEVLNKKDLNELPVQSLPDALNYLPGVDVRQRGPMGVQADLSIRGSTFEQALLLLNGVRLSDPQTGHHMELYIYRVKKIIYTTINNDF